MILSYIVSDDTNYSVVWINRQNISSLVFFLDPVIIYGIFLSVHRAILLSIGKLSSQSNC